MLKKNSFNYEELIDCANGKLFGHGNAKLPSPPMLMFHRITNVTENNDRDIFILSLIRECVSNDRKILVLSDRKAHCNKLMNVLNSETKKVEDRASAGSRHQSSAYCSVASSHYTYS